MYNIAHFPACAISFLWDSESLFSKFNNIEFSVNSAPPRPFICLLSLLSCGPVISGTCLRTRTVTDRTPAIGAHGRIRCFARALGQGRLSGCVWALQTHSYNSLDCLTQWSVLSKKRKVMFDWYWDLFLRGCRFTLWWDGCSELQG